MKFLTYFNFLVSLLLIAGFVFVSLFFNKEIKSIKTFFVSTNNNLSNSNENKLNSSADFVCDENCSQIISREISQKVNSLSLPTVKPQPTIAGSQKTQEVVSYIPIVGPINTTSASWSDAPGTDFYLDLKNSYGSKATASWEAFLKVAHSNGVAYARIYDVTHGIAVDGSEISLSNNSQLTRVSSPAINFWSGNNLYRIQLKSLNTFEVTFASGRVVIVSN